MAHIYVDRLQTESYSPLSSCLLPSLIPSGIRLLKESSQLQRIPGRLTDMFEAIRPEMDAPEISSDNDQHILNFL